MKNKIVLATVLAMVVVFSVMLVSAGALTSTLYNPLNNTNHTGTITYNCTTPAFAQAENVTIYINSSTGTMTSLGVIPNSSVNQSVWEGSVAITSTHDGTGYNVTCLAGNESVNAYSAEISATGIMLDSTDPVCNVTLEHPTIAYKGLQTVIYYSSDVIERVSTSLTINGPGSQSTTTHTDANGPIELTSQETKYAGRWELDMTVTDRAGNTCTDSATFKSYIGDKDEEVPTRDSGKTLLFVIIAAVILWLIFGNKKK